MLMSPTVAAKIANGATTLPAASVIVIPAAVGAVTTVDVPPVTDKNSVFPMAWLSLLIALKVSTLAAGRAVHSAHVFKEPRLEAKL
jgi:hypothetical protein